jgi:hypothetical protein
MVASVGNRLIIGAALTACTALVGIATPANAMEKLLKPGGCGDFYECEGGGTPTPGPAPGAPIVGVGRGPSTDPVGKDTRRFPCHYVRKRMPDGSVRFVKVCPY